MKGFILLMLILFFFKINAQDIQTMAVMDFEAHGISQNDVSIILSRLRSELVNLSKYTIVEREKMDEILKEQGFQLSGCTSNECVVEAGKLLGVQYMLSGVVGLLGKRYTIDLRMIDVETGKVFKTFSRNYEGQIEGLLDILPGLAQEITGIKTASEYGEPIQFQYEKTQDIIFELNIRNAIPIIDHRSQGKPQNSKKIIIPFTEGEHTIQFIADGYRPSEQRTIYVRIGQSQKLRFELKRDQSKATDKIKPIPFASVNFFSGIPSVDVIIDGVFAGKTGPSGISVLLSASEKGEDHEVIYKKPKYLPKYMKIKVYTNKNNPDINATPSPNFGTLIVACEQGPAKIYINGKLNYRRASKEGQRFPEFVTGKYKIRVEKDRYFPSNEQDVFVPVGKEAKVVFNLKPAWGDLSLTSKPSGAKVYLDGNLIGKTPLELTGETGGLLEGSYNFKFDLESPLYPPVEKLITIKPGQKRKEIINFNDISGTIVIKVDPGPIRVLVNGKEDVYLSNGKAVKYPEGSYKIEIYNSGPHKNSYLPVRKDVIMVRGKQVVISKTLTAKKGLLFLHSNIPGTQFIVKDLLENKEVIKNDKIENIPVLTGMYEITADARSKGYILKKKKVNIAEGFRDVINFEFTEEDKKALIAERKKRMEEEKRLKQKRYIENIPKKYPYVFLNPDKYYYQKYKGNYSYSKHGFYFIANATGLHFLINLDFIRLITFNMDAPQYHSYWEYATTNDKIMSGFVITLEALHSWILLGSRGLSKGYFINVPVAYTYAIGLVMGAIFDLLEYHNYKEIHQAILTYEAYPKNHLSGTKRLKDKILDGTIHVTYVIEQKTPFIQYTIPF